MLQVVGTQQCPRGRETLDGGPATAQTGPEAVLHRPPWVAALPEGMVTIVRSSNRCCRVGVKAVAVLIEEAERMSWGQSLRTG